MSTHPVARPTFTSILRESIADENKRKERVANENSSRAMRSAPAAKGAEQSAGSSKHAPQYRSTITSGHKSVEKETKSEQKNENNNKPQDASATTDNIDIRSENERNSNDKESMNLTMENLKTKQKDALKRTKAEVSSQGAKPKKSPGTASTAKDHTNTRAARRERDNLKFYQNKIPSKPYPGNTIEEMLRWKGDYSMLETNHRYIQWLFPIPEGRGLNPCAQPLLDDEAEEMRNDDAVLKRVLNAYEMMLDFYGLQLEERVRGKIKLSPNWQERFAHLNRSGHNKMRITRILKSIGELGYERFQAPLVEFLMTEATNGSLPALNGSCMSHWIATVKDPEEQSVLYRRFNRLPVPPPVAEEALESEDEEDDQSQNSAITPSSGVKEEKEIHVHKPETVDKTGHKAENNRKVDQATAISGSTKKRVSDNKGSGNDEVERKLKALIVGLDDENEDATNGEHHLIQVPVESYLNSRKEESGQKAEHIGDFSESKSKPKNRELGIFKAQVEHDKNTNLECQLNDPDVVNPEDQYPESADSEKLDKNLRFYRNELLSSPSPGYSIDTMLRHKGNHKFFDDHPAYIQWLFPTRRQSSFNLESQPLQEHEIKAIREDTTLSERVLEAYRTVLDYFGMQLEDDIEGRIKPIPETFKDRWKFINKCCPHGYLCFTRILTSLGELGFERFQVPLIQFLITEGVDHEMLPTLSGKNIMHWLHAVTDQQERYIMLQKYQILANRSPQMSELEAGVASLKLSHCAGHKNDSSRGTAHSDYPALRLHRQRPDLPGPDMQLNFDISTVPETTDIDSDKYFDEDDEFI